MSLTRVVIVKALGAKIKGHPNELSGVGPNGR